MRGGHSPNKWQVSIEQHAAMASKRVNDLTTPRPMSEAPRDGTKVLAWWEGADGYLTTWWDREAHGFGAWVGTWIGGADGLHFPTHFLPHPEEPK
jgi:hypothetical protein